MQNENIKEKTCTEASQIKSNIMNQKQMKTGREIIKLIGKNKMTVEEAHYMLSALSNKFKGLYVPPKKYILCECGLVEHIIDAKHCGICGKELTEN